MFALVINVCVYVCAYMRTCYLIHDVLFYYLKTKRLTFYPEFNLCPTIFDLPTKKAQDDISIKLGNIF